MVFAIIFRTPFLQLPIILMANGQLAKIAIYISLMNSKKLRSPARATFKNPNFQSLCELGKN